MYKRQVELVFLIVFTTVISYCAALAIEKSPKKSLRKLCLAATLVCSLGVLLFYKYFDFLAGSVISAATLFGAKLEPFSLGLILPVGISFYTFQTLSYVIDAVSYTHLDVYKRQELMDLNGKYAALFRMQSENYRDDGDKKF